MSDIEDMSQEETGKRREYVRISQSFKVSYSSPEAFINSYLFDISTGGIFVKTDSPMDKGETISLKIFLPDGDKEMEALGEVVWSNKDKRVTPERTFPPGMGVKFLKLSTENKIRLSLNILKYYD
jgi:type IV pilus assembly protein PilZ